MRWIQEKPIILIPLFLLLAFLVFPLMHEEKEPKVKIASVAPEKFASTGFPDYDLLPDNLKQRMEELVKEDSIHRYGFCYFFEVDDINRHYYLEDNPDNIIIESTPVQNQETFALIDKKLSKPNNGFRVEYNEEAWKNAKPEDVKYLRKTAHRHRVDYIFPEDEPDFRQLRVGIFKDTTDYFKMHENELNYDLKTYSLKEVDTPPSPVRGTEYFQNVIRKYLEDKLVYFNFYDMEGEVKAEFTIGGKADSPQIIEGFSTREKDRDEAYKLDGLIVKALNDPKVRWKSGIKNGKSVNTRVGMSFYFNFNEKGNLELSMSDIYPATKTF